MYLCEQLIEMRESIT